MVIREKYNIFQLFFASSKAIAPNIRYKLYFNALLSLVVSVFDYFHPLFFADISLILYSILGVGLSLFLGFQNNTAYARWWEGRNTWGLVGSESRSLVRNLRASIHREKNKVAIKKIDHLAIMYILALKGECKCTNAKGDFNKYVGTVLGKKVIDEILCSSAGAYKILVKISDEINKLHKSGQLSDIAVSYLVKNLDTLAFCVTSANKLVDTPIPFSYRLLLERITLIFCTILPFGLIAHTGTATILFSVFLSYMFFGFEYLAADLENPFKEGANRLALDTMCLSQIRHILEMEGVSINELPPLPKVVDSILD